MGAPDAVSTPAEHDVILFDGVCNLCNSSVIFIIKRDRHAKFRFASLQSSFGRKQLERVRLDPHNLYSILLIHKDLIFERSDAVLEILKRMDGIWPVFYSMKIIPRFIRDFVYSWIATNRYHFFGKKESCMIPTKELRSRFLE